MQQKFGFLPGGAHKKVATQQKRHVFVDLDDWMTGWDLRAAEIYWALRWFAMPMMPAKSHKLDKSYPQVLRR